MRSTAILEDLKTQANQGDVPALGDALADLVNWIAAHAEQLADTDQKVLMSVSLALYRNELEKSWDVSLADMMPPLEPLAPPRSAQIGIPQMMKAAHSAVERLDNPQTYSTEGNDMPESQDMRQASGAGMSRNAHSGSDAPASHNGHKENDEHALSDGNRQPAAHHASCHATDYATMHAQSVIDALVAMRRPAREAASKNDISMTPPRRRWTDQPGWSLTYRQ